MNKNNHDNIRMILKFDTGADGFLKMIIILGISAVILLIVGIIFLNILLKDMGQLS